VTGPIGPTGATGATGATGSGVFARGGTFINSTGLSTGNVIVWRAPFSCTVTGLYGYRVGGTGATVNAGKGTTASPTSPILASDLSLSSSEAWTSGGAVQNTAFVANDPLVIELTGVTGSVTEIGIQVEFTKP
jgi:hypothetical protein